MPWWAWFLVGVVTGSALTIVVALGLDDEGEARLEAERDAWLRQQGP